MNITIPENSQAKKFLVDSSSYTIKRKIGNTTFLVQQNQTNQEYAMKVIQCTKLNGQQQQLLITEIEIIIATSFPSLLNLCGFSLPSLKDPSLRLITNFMPQNSLRIMIDSEKTDKSPVEWTITQKYIVILGIASAMNYLHSISIIHHNFIPENILLDKNFEPHVTDFDSLQQIIHGESNHDQISVEKAQYLPSDFFSTDLTTDKSINVYSFGMICYELFTKMKPYPDILNLTYLKTKICNGEQPALTSAIPEGVRALISKCIDQIPSNRPTFEEIISYLVQESNFPAGSQTEMILNYISRTLSLQITVDNGTNNYSDLVLSLQTLIFQQNEEIISLQSSLSSFFSNVKQEQASLRNEIEQIRKNHSSTLSEFKDILNQQYEALKIISNENEQLSSEIQLLKSKGTTNSQNPYRSSFPGHQNIPGRSTSPLQAMQQQPQQVSTKQPLTQAPYQQQQSIQGQQQQQQQISPRQQISQNQYQQSIQNPQSPLSRLPITQAQYQQQQIQKSIGQQQQLIQNQSNQSQLQQTQTQSSSIQQPIQNQYQTQQQQQFQAQQLNQIQILGQNQPQAISPIQNQQQQQTPVKQQSTPQQQVYPQFQSPNQQSLQSQLQKQQQQLQQQQQQVKSGQFNQSPLKPAQNLQFNQLQTPQTQQQQLYNKLFNGLFANLTTECHCNPVDKGVLSILGSSLNQSESEKLKFIIDNTWKDSWFSAASPNDDSFITFEFSRKIVNATAYAIRSSSSAENGPHLKNWVLEGSNSLDSSKWIEIDSQINCNSLNGPLKMMLFQCKNANAGFFRFFRLRQTGPSHNGKGTGFAINNIEFFGQLRNA